MTDKLATIKAPAAKATMVTLPRLAGNLPRTIQYCPSKYLRKPMRSTSIAMPMKVPPNGLPTRMMRSRFISLPLSAGEFGSRIVVLSRKSCVTATPIEAKESDVRSQARKVRSEGDERMEVSAARKSDMDNYVETSLRIGRSGKRSVKK
ncbi:hypothetical protein KEM55_001938 [Ascosphaera atra]|nr:hypothetical protein KEM55_001938 [Ascosphaera atra]